MASYPRDEFDAAAEAREIVGAHRSPRKRSRLIVPVLLVVVLAPLTAWALFTFTLRGQVPQAAEALQASLGGGDASQHARAGTGGARGEGAGSDTLPPADPAAVDRATGVTLLDGTEDGSGEDVAAALEDSGYENVRTGTYSASDPATTTVYMRSAEVTDTARDVARIASAAQGGEKGGAPISVVESAAAASSAPIVVVLR